MSPEGITSNQMLQKSEHVKFITAHRAIEHTSQDWRIHLLFFGRKWTVDCWRFVNSDTLSIGEFSSSNIFFAFFLKTLPKMSDILRPNISGWWTMNTYWPFRPVLLTPFKYQLFTWIWTVAYRLCSKRGETLTVWWLWRPWKMSNP